MDDDLETLERGLIGAARDAAVGATQRLVDAGVDPTVVLESGMAEAMFELGKDVAASGIVDAIGELQPDIVGLSALLTTTVPYKEVVIRTLERERLRDRVKVMVGGAPVTPEWAEKIGADGYAKNVREAVEVAKRLLGEPSTVPGAAAS